VLLRWQLLAAWEAHFGDMGIFWAIVSGFWQGRLEAVIHASLICRTLLVR
jgi:hypothetical protein